MDAFVAYLLKNKEWIFSGVGVLAITAMYALSRSVHRWWGGRRRQVSVESISSAPPASKEPTKHIIEYIINLRLDPNVTPEEVSVLDRFSKFPRGQRTQGYRLDWIYEELLRDMAASTAHVYLENLLDKGYLERWTTRLGNTYYRLSDNGRRYLVGNQFVPLNDA